MKHQLRQISPALFGFFILASAVLTMPNEVLAAASSSGRVQFNKVELLDLNVDDGITPGITWLGTIDGILDAEAHIPGFSPATDHKMVSQFKSDSASASKWFAVSATSSITAGPTFFSQIQSVGYTGPGGYYASIAQLTGLIALSPMTAITFSGTVSAGATAGPSSADYAHGAAYVSISALEKPPVDPVSCIITNDNFCSKSFSFTISNDTLEEIEFGYDMLTSVDGFSAPVPEPSSAALLLAGLGGLMARRVGRQRGRKG